MADIPALRGAHSVNPFEALAARCSPVGGPVTEHLRDIDRNIQVTLGLHGRRDEPPYYTSSLDAAVSLIPDGHDWILEHVNGGLTIGCRIGHNDPDRMSWGDTTPLAICAAALRARAVL
jgi:hypothetical protein